MHAIAHIQSINEMYLNQTQWKQLKLSWWTRLPFHSTLVGTSGLTLLFFLKIMATALAISCSHIITHTATYHWYHWWVTLLAVISVTRDCLSPISGISRTWLTFQHPLCLFEIAFFVQSTCGAKIPRWYPKQGYNNWNVQVVLAECMRYSSITYLIHILVPNNRFSSTQKLDKKTFQ